MAERPMEGMMNVTLEKVKELVGSNTIIGDPIHTGDTTILPVSKVTFGFAGGGSDFGMKTAKELFGGGTGAGVSVTPVAFLVISKEGNVRTIQLSDSSSTVDRLLNKLPEIADWLSSNFVKKETAEAEPGVNTKAVDPIETPIDPVG